MFFSPPARHSFERFIAPRVEVELAFVLPRRLEGTRRDDLRRPAGHGHVTRPLEINRRTPSSNSIATPGRAQGCSTPSRTFAANRGHRRRGRPSNPPRRDHLRWVGALLLQECRGFEETGLCGGRANHPRRGRMAGQQIAPYGRRPLKSGDIILGGSFTRPDQHCARDVLHADYGPLAGIDAFCSDRGDDMELPTNVSKRDPAAGRPKSGVGGAGRRLRRPNSGDRRLSIVW